MKRIPLTQGQFALVDDKNFDWLNQWKWCAQRDRSGTFYAVRAIRLTRSEKITVRMNRLILGVTDERLVDHRNRNTLDNQEHNLRIATNSTNAMNRGVTRFNRAGLKGVTPLRNKWRALIKVNGRSIILGNCFETPQAAHAAYCEAAKKYHGEFARFQ